MTRKPLDNDDLPELSYKLIFVVFEMLKDKKPAVLTNPEELKNFGVTVAQINEEIFFEKIEHKCNQVISFDIKRIYQLLPMENRTTTIPTIRMPDSSHLFVAINILVPKNISTIPLQFDVIQQSGKRVLGGSTYVLNPRKNERKEKVQQSP